MPPRTALRVLPLALFFLLHTAKAEVHVGAQVLRDSGYAALHQQGGGERIAVLTNPTGVFPDSLEHIVDALHASSNVNVACVLAPEHGFRGTHQAEHGDEREYIDDATGLRVFSVYRANATELRDVILRQCNATTVLVDMQDVGTRLYTFVWTMYDVMAALSQSRQRRAVVVLDRPNPLGGVVVEGPVLNTSCCASRYGRAAIPHRHGMTIGELALFFRNSLASTSIAASASAGLALTVIPMRGWERTMGWDGTGLPWIPPSPNIPTAAAAAAYAGTVFLEASTACEGRGTTTPFQSFGAPWLVNLSSSVPLLADALNSAPGCAVASRQAPPPPRPPQEKAFRDASFTPTFFKYNNSVVRGVQWVRLPASPGTSTTSTGSGTARRRRRPRPHSQTSCSSASGAAPPPVFACGAAILRELRQRDPSGETFRWTGSWFGWPDDGTLLDLYAGTPRMREAVDGGASGEDITGLFAEEARVFAEVTRRGVLLY